MLTNNRNALVASLLCLSLLFSHCTAHSQEPAVTPSDSEIIPKCVEAISANYAKLTTIRARLYWVLLDPKIDKEQVTEIGIPGGGIATLTEAPRTALRVKFTSKGSDYRHETPPGTIFIRRGETLTEVSEKTVQTRKLSECPGYGTLDPRELGGNGFHHGLLDLLRKSKLLTSKSNDDGTIEIRAEIESPIERGSPPIRFHFGSQPKLLADSRYFLLRRWVNRQLHGL